jgi:flavodoxin
VDKTGIFNVGEFLMDEHYKKALVVYSSEKGSTQKIAQSIYATLQTYGWEVKEERLNSPFPIGMWRGSIYVLKKYFLNINPNKSLLNIDFPVEDCSPYQLIFIGSWVQWHHPPQAIDLWLEKVGGLAGKKVALFLTCGGTPKDTLGEIGAALEEKGAQVIGLLEIKLLSFWKSISQHFLPKFLTLNFNLIGKADLYRATFFAQEIAEKFHPSKTQSNFIPP